MYIGPDLHDYRPLLRGWIRCAECDGWFHPDEFALHTSVYHEDEEGNRVIMHDLPKRRIDESD